MSELATLGGGCFWCTEAVFSELKGVLKTEPGFSGGNQSNPTYEEVCTDTTGHAEVVQVTFDPDIISYRNLMSVFFSIHDPTTPNRQGDDIGTQYRSIILYHNEAQRKIAVEVMKEVENQKIWNAKLVTELVPFKTFYRAEDYHKDYFRNNPRQGYCQAVISPKVAKFRKHYFDQLKSR